MTVPIIYHLSDLHIRSGDEVKSRYHEYKYIFKNFVNHLKMNACGNRKAVTIITGDIFHHKSKLESPGISLFYKFLKQVSKITPVFIIRGNHDYKQWESNEVDLISSMLLPEIDNITYLNSTGTYKLTDEIGVGVLAIQDVIKAGASSSAVKADNKTPFPDPAELGDSKYKIALFHGNVDNNRMFEGYDAALLGDIHIQNVNGLGLKDIPIVGVCVGGEGAEHPDVRAIFQKNWEGVDCPWGYAGSMIRQNVGETIEGHGFLCWDLENKLVTGFHINNIVDLAAMECEKDIFKGARLGVEGEDREKKSKADKEESQPCILQNTPDMWVDYVDKNGKVRNSSVLIGSPELLLIDDIEGNEVIQNKVVERNNKIKKRLEAYVDSMATGNMCNRNPFRLLKMTWEWLLCYGADNQFYFNKLDGKVSTISGRNGHGKTSFLEIILLALYGQGFTSRNNKNNTNSVINIHKPANATSNVSITLQIDNVGMVRVNRAFLPNTGKPVPSASKHFSLEKWDSEKNKWASVASGRLAVDKWVDSNIGPIHSFLLSCMVSQNADCDFFSMCPMDQKEMLDNALCIDTHTRYMELLKESRLGYQAIAELLASSLATMSKQLCENASTHLERVRILDSQIVKVPNNLPVIRDLFEREYYQSQVARHLSAIERRHVEDVIYEIEQIKRDKARPRAKVAVAYDHPLEFYEEGLAAMDPESVPVATKKVVYNECAFEELGEKVKGAEYDREAGFDKGPYNISCECCKIREKAYSVRSVYDDYVNQWWAKRQFLENTVEAIKYDQRESKLQILNKELAECKSYEKNINNVIEILESYDDIMAANKNSKLEMERSKLIQEYEMYQRLQSEKEKYAEQLKSVHDRLAGIMDVNTCLESYISWLYTKNVIPLVEKYTNEIMNLIDPQLKLKGRIVDGKGFEWSITTTSAAQVSCVHPTIEKASGFQRFICGLAIRIALGTIGASGIKPRQLFLDEGFTSCDSTNLTKVPNFLTMLLKLYDSILLVTHLEDLKDFCMDATILIIRDEDSGTSRMNS